LAPSSNNYAKLTETITYEDINPNTMYSCLATLADTTRALLIAQEFQFYRITAVEWKYKPYFNTFQDSIGGSASNPSMPQFYMIMSRNGVFPAYDLLSIKSEGARARQFNKDLVVKYKPNTTYQTAISGTDGTSVAIAPAIAMNRWLPCNQALAISATSNWSQIPYYGHQFYIDQAVPTQAANATIGTLELSLVIEFKNPGLPPPPQEYQRHVVAKA